MKMKRASKKVTKKRYTTPTLKVYGKLKDLTTGGTGSRPESGSNSQTKFP
jgi:hypothetical protein